MKRGRGRPPAEVEMRHISIRITPEMDAWLRAQPGTITDQIRDLLRDAMKS
jgi:hypothetical protein